MRKSLDYEKDVLPLICDKNIDRLLFKYDRNFGQASHNSCDATDILIKVHGGDGYIKVNSEQEDCAFEHVDDYARTVYRRCLKANNGVFKYWKTYFGDALKGKFIIK